jgi:hypothetical protein
MAMMGILATYSGKILARPDEDHLARVSVSYADALLAELARTCKDSSQVEPEWTKWKGVEKSVQAHGHPFVIICKNEVEAELAAIYHNAEMKRVTGTEGK